MTSIAQNSANYEMAHSRVDSEVSRGSDLQRRILPVPLEIEILEEVVILARIP